MPRDFYVYMLFRPDGRPCYVGKGKGRRFLIHSVMGGNHYNPHLAAIFAKAERDGGVITPLIVSVGMTESEAYAEEIETIAICREIYGQRSLANMTSGGDGCLSPAPELREKMSARMRAMWATPEVREKLAAAMASEQTQAKCRAAWTADRREKQSSLMKQKHAAGRPVSQATRDKIRMAFTQERRAAQSVNSKGRTISDEHRAINRAAQKARFTDPAERAKMRDIQTKRLQDPEARAKMISFAGKNHTPETIEKMRAHWTPERKAAQAEVARRVNAAKKAKATA